MKEVLGAYKRQKYDAAKRGIEFEFEFEEWLTWWEQQLGPDWIKLRGCRKGQFCMARKGDKGPYASWNVDCLTTTQNHKEQAANGLCGFKKGVKLNKNYKKTQIKIYRQGKKITPEIARIIYAATGTQRLIAKTHNVSERLVRLIKKKQVWQRELSPRS